MKWKETVKEYLTFTKKERLGVFVLATLLAFAFLVPPFYHYWRPPSVPEIDSALARRLLGLPIHDATGGYRCWHADLIRRAGILDIDVQGYAFLFVSADLCRRAGARFGEVPIIFVDRQYGKSKMSRRIIFEAIRVLFSLSIHSRSGNAGAKQND